MIMYSSSSHNPQSRSHLILFSHFTWRHLTASVNSVLSCVSHCPNLAFYTDFRRSSPPHRFRPPVARKTGVLWSFFLNPSVPDPLFYKLHHALTNKSLIVEIPAWCYQIQVFCGTSCAPRWTIAWLGEKITDNWVILQALSPVPCTPGTGFYERAVNEVRLPDHVLTATGYVEYPMCVLGQYPIQTLEKSALPRVRTGTVGTVTQSLAGRRTAAELCYNGRLAKRLCICATWCYLVPPFQSLYRYYSG